MSDPVPSSAISDATTGGLSLIVVTGGSDGQVLTQQADGTYAPEAVSAGDFVGPASSTDNAVVRFDGTTGKLAQNSGVTISDAGALTASQNTSAASITAANTTGPAVKISDGTYNVHLIAYISGSSDALLVRNSANSGNGNFEASRGTFAIVRTTGNTICEGLLFCGMYTVATLPSASGNDRATAVVTDSSVAMAGNYGATVSGGGANKVRVFSNGTNWLIA